MESCYTCYVQLYHDNIVFFDCGLYPLNVHHLHFVTFLEKAWNLSTPIKVESETVFIYKVRGSGITSWVLVGLLGGKVHWV